MPGQISLRSPLSRTRRQSVVQRSKILNPLLRWYRRASRPLPWRDTDDPYCIWVAEILLQQTQASRGQVYFRRFVKKFPSFRSLAKSSKAELLRVCRGIGYYRRLDNMQAAARIIVAKHSGKLPKDVVALRALPGIGPYTANAVACFAFGQPLAAIDTNLQRVLTRVIGCTSVELPRLAEKLFQGTGRRAALANHALMDLGATLCRSRVVYCNKCPLRSTCAFFRSGKARKLMAAKTIRSVRPKSPAVDVGVACIHRDGRYLIGKRPVTKGGEWEFPGGKREPGESVRACLKREIQEELGVEIAVRPPFLIREWGAKGDRWRLHFCRCQILAGRPRRREHSALKWLTPVELSKHPFPAANRQAVKKLLTMRH